MGRAATVVLGTGLLASRLAETLDAPLVNDVPSPAPRTIWNAAGLLPTTASPQDAERALATTRSAVTAAATNDATLHHLSTMAIGGDLEGSFTEKQFDEGQSLPHPLAQAAFDQELAVRTALPSARIHRLAHVLGASDSGVGEVDGPAHFFEALLLTSLLMPARWPLYGPDFGQTDVVPLDFAVDALVALGSLPDTAGRTFHIGSGAGLRTADVHNAFAIAAHAPLAHVLERSTGPGSLAFDLYNRFMASPACTSLRARTFRMLSVPDEAIRRLMFEFSFESSETARLHGLTCPPLESYAPAVWDYWLRELRIKP